MNAAIFASFGSASTIFVIFWSFLSPDIIFALLVYCAPPRSARYSRMRENHITTNIARNPNTSWNAIYTPWYARYERPFSSPSRERNDDTARAAIWENSMTNVFITPWRSVRVTISQLSMCAISCHTTHSISHLSIWFRSPVETATRELFLVAPVANALGSADS